MRFATLRPARLVRWLSTTLLLVVVASTAAASRADTVASLLGNFTVNQYSELSLAARRIEIRHAIEAIFPVKVESIRTLRVHGKPKRMGRYAGHRPDWKKAIVTLKKGQTIELFEQV